MCLTLAIGFATSQGSRQEMICRRTDFQSVRPAGRIGNPPYVADLRSHHANNCIVLACEFSKTCKQIGQIGQSDECQGWLV